MYGKKKKKNSSWWWNENSYRPLVVYDLILKRLHRNVCNRNQEADKVNMVMLWEIRRLWKPAYKQ